MSAAMSRDSLRPSPAARGAVRGMTAYPCDREAVEVDLSDNTNRFGSPPAAMRALREVDDEEATRYPGLHSRRLRQAIAAYADVGEDEVVTGCGSDDILDSAMRAFGEPGDAIAYCDPTFSMVPAFARLNGLTPVPVPFTYHHDIDPDALLATGARIVYICSPNNPTSVAASREAIERVLDRAPGLVILDEAYGEFSDSELRHGWMALAPTYGNVLVTRTLSKAFGLAGLRVGYGIGAAGIVSEVEKARGPYKTTAPAERAAIAALTEDVEWMKDRAWGTVLLRGMLDLQLGDRRLWALRSDANFLCVPVPGAERIAARMREHGVVVRAFAALPGIGDALRIGVGPEPMTERMLEALDLALAAERGEGRA